MSFFKKKPFYVNYLRLFDPSKPLQHSLMSVDRPEDYPRASQLKGSSLEKAPALPTNIRLGWKGLPGTNTLTYYKICELIT